MLNGRMTRGRGPGVLPVCQPDGRAADRGILYDQLSAVRAGLAPSVPSRLLDEEEETPGSALPGHARRTPKGHISFQHVSFGYQPDRLLMKDISFDGPARTEDRRGGQHRRGQDHPGQPAHAVL